MTAATGMTASANRRGLLDNSWAMRVVQEQRNQSSPEEKYCLHDAQSEGGLQHGACLVNVQRKGVICALAVVPEWAKGDPDGVTTPMRAVCFGNKTELVDSGNEGAEEAHVYERDEYCGPFCC